MVEGAHRGGVAWRGPRRHIEPIVVTVLTQGATSLRRVLLNHIGLMGGYLGEFIFMSIL